MKNAVLIYPHQLFEKNKLLDKNSVVYLIEEPLMFTQYKFHKQKLIFHRASMKAYKELLEKLGHHVVYVDHFLIAKTEELVSLLVKDSITSVTFYDLVDNWLHKKLVNSLNKHNITYIIRDTPMFLTSASSLEEFFEPLQNEDAKFIMSSFYKWQRKRLQILVDANGVPVGGKWSYDIENRKKIPKGMQLLDSPKPNTSKHVLEAKVYAETYFKNNYGDTEAFFYPIDHKESIVWLEQFLVDKLELFGPYEDAVLIEDNFLFHSMLSPLLNSGILTPGYVVERTLAFAKQHDIKLASLEGFIRQVIGWREYIRAVYEYKGTTQRKGNYFDSKNNLPASFWNASTNIDPIDDTINSCIKYAYSHHISRLMIMGNFMNLCQFKPDDVYRWFMEMYIDSYDWVMVPNVYGMTLFADGGSVTTKPYISSSSYIIKMSNYKKGAWSEIWDALFWYFVGKHFELLSSEGRLGFIGITYKKISPDKKQKHIDIAKKFLSGLIHTG